MATLDIYPGSQNLLPEHTEIDYRTGDTLGAIRDALQSRLQPGATAEDLGFNGFEGKKVLDVGTRDGRNLTIPHNLGAAEVYGLDPDIESLKIAVDTGQLDFDTALGCTVQELPQNMKSTFDVVMALNMLLPISERETAVKGIYDALDESGELIATFVEPETMRSLSTIFNRYFEFRTKTLWKQSKYNEPHKYILVGKKRANLNS